MLRDRLRIWGANTKRKRSTTQAITSAIPSRVIDTSAADMGHRHLLRELDQWYDLAWQRNQSPDQIGRPDEDLARQFYNTAFAAVHRGSSRFWRSARELADTIAQSDWSFLHPEFLVQLACLTVQVLTRPLMQQVQSIWTIILTRNLCNSHPVSLLLNCLLRSKGQLDVRLWLAISSMVESKVRMHRCGNRQLQTLAWLRTQIARMFLDLNEDVHSETMLQQYVQADRDSLLASMGESNLPCEIYFILGRIHLRQARGEKALHFFHYGQDLNNHKRLPTTIQIAIFLADNSGAAVEAEMVLQELASHLWEGLGSCSFDDDIEVLGIQNQLQGLYNNLQGMTELQTAIAQLKFFQLGEPEGDEDDQSVSSEQNNM